MSHVYSLVKSHPPSGDLHIATSSLLQMRNRLEDFPNAKWAAAQCVDLSSSRLGQITFVAVGPENAIKCLTDTKLTHWSYYFIGFVNLKTGVIEPYAPPESASCPAAREASI